MADTVEFTIVSPEKWVKILVPQPAKKKDQYEHLLDAMEDRVEDRRRD